MTSTFYWMADIPPGTNLFSYCREINDVLCVTTPWLNLFLNLISDHALVKRVQTKPFHPIGGAHANFNFPGSGLLGNWPFESGDYSDAAWIKFHTANDFSGKHGVRIGPLGSGATDDDRWNPLFSVAAFNFGALCGSTYLTPSGIDFRGCAIDKFGLFSPLVGAQLSYPPSRQKQRRRIL